MKKKWIVFLLVCVPLCLHAQEPTMASFFKQMPDSLMPYLSKNNRLDMVDFMEANMKAEVTNLLEGKSCMTALTSDSLSIRMNDVLQVNMRLLPPHAAADSSKQMIRMRRIYTIKENQTMSIVNVYDTAWKLLHSYVEQSALLEREESLFPADYR